MKIVLTGASSHLGKVLIPRLLEDPAVTELVGVDWRPCHYPDPRFRLQQMDIRSDTMADVLAGVDVVIHLAFVVLRSDLGRARHDRALMRSINVEGSCHVFERAIAAGVGAIIHCSSASVYRQDGQDQPMKEDHPYGPVPDFIYAQDKADVEVWLDQLEAERHSGPRIVRLRPHGIVGPHAQQAVRRLVRTRIYPSAPNPQPLLQCVHEQDVADALVLAATCPVAGAFNLATDDACSLRDLVKRRWPALGIPLPFIEGMARVSWRLLPTGTDPSWLPALRRSLVVDNTRAREVLGWRPRFATIAHCVADG